MALENIKIVEIEINHACNRKCSYCPNSVETRKTQGYMSLSLYQLILNNLKEVHFKGIISYNFYNEPMLHPEIIDFVKHTKQTIPQVTVQIYTNGTFLDRTQFEQLASAGVDKFIVTRHEQDIQIKHYAFGSLVTELNFEERQKVTFRNHTELKLFNRGGILKHISSQGLALHPCEIPEFMLAILVDGRIVSCFEDYNETLVLGDLKAESLKDIWQSEGYVSFRKNLKRGLRHFYKACRDCNRAEVLNPF